MMNGFHEYPLSIQIYPSRSSECEAPIALTTKKKRKILKARRLIRKATENDQKPITTTCDEGQAPVPDKSVAFRAIRKSTYKMKLRHSTIRQSDNSFLENEFLCGIDNRNKKLLQEVAPSQHDGISKINVNEENTQKRKSSGSTNVLSKKRRTLEGDNQLGKVINNNNSKQPLFKSKPMPNFSRIFKVQSSNVENIVQYKERKAERAATLMSGSKPSSFTAKATFLIPPQIRKELTFTTKDSPNIAKLPQLKAEKTTNNGIIPAKFNFNENILTNRLRNATPQPMSSSTPNISNKVQLKKLKQESFNKFGFKQETKTKKAPIQGVPKIKTKSFENGINKTSSNEIKTVRKRPETPKVVSKNPPKSVDLVASERKNLVTLAAKPHRLRKDELVQAVKARGEREIVTSRRHEIKGVRLNRRFQLLMQMRNKDTSII